MDVDVGYTNVLDLDGPVFDFDDPVLRPFHGEPRPFLDEPGLYQPLPPLPRPSEVPHPFTISKRRLKSLSNVIDEDTGLTEIGLLREVLLIQAQHNVSQVATGKFVSMMNKFNGGTTSYRKIHNLVSELCTPNYTKVDMCPRDCIAFRDSKWDNEYKYENLRRCPECDAHRYKELPSGEYSTVRRSLLCFC